MTCLNRYRPYPALRFADPVDDPDEGGQGGGGDLGFPAGTAIKDMTDAQQAAYWKHQSRGHENRAKARGDYDRLKADSDELARLRAQSQTEQERAIAEAREEARREGENLGAGRYLNDAIRNHLGRTTGKTDEELDPVMAVIDTSKFVTDTGDIDSAKLADFASTFGITTTPQGGDPVRDALTRGKLPPAGHGGSIRELAARRREELTHRS